jgi:protein-S-isoprenylcysteine O-methyltransferase Ste14/membrane protease YdiL (CAAX protease family)
MFARALLAFLALPGVLAFAVPLAWLSSSGHTTLVQPMGLLPLLLGVAALLWCVRDFYVSGAGTLAPWAPPANLVVGGLYRYTRNPMYVAVTLILLGWAISFASQALLVYAIVIAAAFHFRVVLGEEPWLAQKHGPAWQEYSSLVPRWFASDDDRIAAGLRRFGPLGIVAMVVIVLSGNAMLGDMIAIPVGGLLVLAWAWRSHTPYRAIGYSRPRSWIATLAAGLLVGIGLKLVMKSVVMPLLGAGPINQAYHFLAGNAAMLPAATWAMLVAAFGEETVFRGYLFERLGKLFGPGIPARASIVLLTSALFGLAHHADQGIAGVQQAAIIGVVFGTLFAVSGRIWTVLFAHAAFDLTALALIYWNLETVVAHAIFS